MAGCFFVVFDWDTARAPHGLESETSLRHHHAGIKTDIERRTSEELCQNAIREAKQHHEGQDLKAKELGYGNGFAFEHGAYCSYSAREGIHVWFSGEVSEWPGLDVVKESHDAYLRDQTKDSVQRNESEWLWTFYRGLTESATLDSDAILDCFGKIRGRFAFVIFDENRKRVLASRDAEGTESFYWGVTQNGQLQFGTNSVDFDHCDPSATLFPSGTVYTSQGDTVAEQPGDKGWVILGSQWPGRLMSFVHDSAHKWRHIKEIPRVNSKGVLCGSVYRIESDKDLSSRAKDQESC
eukprot:g6593.t1